MIAWRRRQGKKRASIYFLETEETNKNKERVSFSIRSSDRTAAARIHPQPIVVQIHTFSDHDDTSKQTRDATDNTRQTVNSTRKTEMVLLKVNCGSSSSWIRLSHTQQQQHFRKHTCIILKQMQQDGSHRSKQKLHYTRHLNLKHWKSSKGRRHWYGGIAKTETITNTLTPEEHTKIRSNFRIVPYQIVQQSRGTSLFFPLHSNNCTRARSV